MSLKRDIRTVTEFKSNAAGLLAQVNRDRRPLIITQNGRARAVVLDPESYDSLKDAVALLQMAAHAQRDIREGRVLKQAEVFRRLETRFARKKDGRPSPRR